MTHKQKFHGIVPESYPGIVAGLSQHFPEISLEFVYVFPFSSSPNICICKEQDYCGSRND